MLLECKNISKAFKSENVLNNLSFYLEEHKTLSILGKSGCGKTTLLKIISGIIQTDNGDIYLRGNRINDIPVNKRNIVYLYQEPLLFPHLNVFENIAFSLRLKKIDDQLVRTKTDEMIEHLELTEQKVKMPHQLSGGQKQRAAFGRALIINPVLLLLDEPFGNLDSSTRESMQNFYSKIANEYKITSIFVTHDLKEAIIMGDKIGLMEKGKLTIFNYVDDFINHPDTGVSKEIDFWKKLRN
ncbi:ABC transporter ATP-binding protein [Ignavibacterium sp.]|uniref:ABC transporter ATP-binding protein n=1 Tax=Ignavibacterium sp. TaxID=2651167 RepID=UPI00307FBAD6